GKIDELLDDSYDHSTERAWRKIVAVALEMKRVIEKIILFKPLAGERFIDRKACDDGGTAAAQAPRERNLAVAAHAHTREIAFAAAEDRSDITCGTDHQIGFVQRYLLCAYAGRNDFKAPVTRLDFHAQIEPERKAAGIEAGPQIRSRCGNNDFSLGHFVK